MPQVRCGPRGVRRRLLRGQGRAAKAKTQLEAAGYAHVVNGGGLGDLRDAPAAGRGR